MISKIFVLVFSWTALFNLPLCCCAQDHRAENAAPLKEPCGHGPKKTSSPSEPHGVPERQAPSLPGSDKCSCSHVARDTFAETAKMSLVIPSSLDVWEDALLDSDARPSSTAEIVLFFDRGPPPDRLGVPIYLSFHHLAL
jgi:hypothetical protein